jgi:VanZ family protein
MRWLRQWGPVAIWAVVILASSNDSLSSDRTATFLNTLFGQVPEWVNLAMRKAGHVLAYGFLGVLAFRASRTMRTALIVVFAVSALDEWHQSFFASRTGTPWDVALDCCGALLAILSVFPAARERFASRPGAD